MARYLIDTNILSYLADTASRFHRPVRGRLAALADEDEVALSVLSLYELHHWFAYQPAQQAAADAIVSDFVILPLPMLGAPRFGALMRDLRAGARRRDLQHAVIDCMIAVTAIEWGAMLVSGDTLFPRLARLAPALRVVNWAAP